MILESKSNGIEQDINGQGNIDVRLEDGLNYTATCKEYLTVQMEGNRKVARLRGGYND
jgi:hypothetical protein